ncbi:hypothetical protein QBC35DRAFT_495334 [Podospora australis]|uniref:Septation initiation network scaffold protein cdc11 n=1 Tax=Podospora australis TaxID=1536484 RepID=A0AAN6WV73_9PEZI|nr:hypothetical protein QBC35DRAFT_495334 [Podospora australis]
MAMIRSKAGLASGLASLEESDAEHAMQTSPDDSSYEDSTQEPFDRPPSREGRPPLSRRPTKQEDPELAERLKQYEEASDMGDIMASLRSQNPPEDVVEQHHGEKATSSWGSTGSRLSVFDEEVISDPPNLRISRNPDWQNHHESPDAFRDRMPSDGSSGPSTQSSFPTTSSRGSSRGSEARKTIAPESVSHLIPDRVGNMVLDRQRNIWIKRKPGAVEPRRPRANSTRSNRSNFLPSEASEDDPFAGIPDLSVDITLEMRNLALATAKKAQAQEAMPRSATPTSPTRIPDVATPRRSVPPSVESPTRRPHGSSQLRVVLPPNEEEPVEHEIRINEDRAAEPRRLTISFSSPIAEVIQDFPEEDEFPWEEDSILHHVAEDVAMAMDSLKRGRRLSSFKGARCTSRSRSTSRGPARHLSFRGQTMMARPISRIDEQEEESAQSHGIQSRNEVSGMELSILPENSVVARDSEDNNGQGSVSFLVATPSRTQGCPAPGMDAAPVISQYVGTFSLSPLSEFTMHHGEDSLPLEASYIVGSHRLTTGDPSKRVMTMSTRQLVEKIAEVEPFEPYWEDMRELELRDKRLGSLHTLDDFCGQLESLDVSNNSIRNLSGIPSSVLHLRMINNQLSSLTAWGHLMNLQYVDVSNNALTSLTAFKNLVHLRCVRVDNNQLVSLDGIKYHKGLQSLRCRGNSIEEVDFAGANLDQLTELDLKDNLITKVSNLEQLTALGSLNLEGNKLTSFGDNFSADPDSASCTALRYLRLDDNQLATLDVNKMPHLRLLHADRNCLSKISGFSRARRIDSLSLREQRGSSPLDLEYLLSRIYEVRKLFLSGNLLGTFEPKVDFLNCQLLEVANCGLLSLPEDFGLSMPNLRVLNVNMNALSDLKTLRYIPRLKRLFVSGNRLADPAKLVSVLAHLPHLVEVDVRDNPVTQGFYAPLLQVILSKPKPSSRPSSSASGSNGKHEEEEVLATEGSFEDKKFVLPDQDCERDRGYSGRLDMETRIRRRIWEVLVRRKCLRVKKLDGLALQRGVPELKDEVWERLVEMGVVLREEPKALEGVAEEGKMLEGAEEEKKGPKAIEGVQTPKKLPAPTAETENEKSPSPKVARRKSVNNGMRKMSTAGTGERRPGTPKTPNGGKGPKTPNKGPKTPKNRGTGSSRWGVEDSFA